jgi:hypothetical protein
LVLRRLIDFRNTGNLLKKMVIKKYTGIQIKMSRSIGKYDLVEVSTDQYNGRFIIDSIGVDGIYIKDLREMTRLSKIVYDPNSQQWKVEGSDLNFKIEFIPKEKMRVIDMVQILFGSWEFKDINRFIGQISGNPNLTMADIVAHPELYDRWYQEPEGRSGPSWYQEPEGRSGPSWYQEPEGRSGPSWYQEPEGRSGPSWYQEPEGRSGPSWDWNELSLNPNFTMNDIVSHPELYDRWNWGNLSWNKNFTMNDIVISSGIIRSLELEELS